MWKIVSDWLINVKNGSWKIVSDWLINVKNGPQKNSFWLANKCEKWHLKNCFWLANKCEKWLLKNCFWLANKCEKWLLKIVSDWLINVKNGSCKNHSVSSEPEVYNDDLEKLWFMLRPIIQYQIISSTLRRFIY